MKKQAAIQFEEEMKVMSPAELRNLKTLEFNRRLKESWVSTLAKDIKSGGGLPPVMEVGNYKGGLFIIDGQHRVFACLEANSPGKVNIRTYHTLEAMRSAVNKFRKQRRHSSSDVIKIGATETSKQILNIAKVFPASVTQIRAIFDAIRKTEDGYTDPEERFVAAILEVITKDKRFISLNSTGSPEEKLRVKNTRGSFQAALSSKDTLYSLTKLCLPHLSNINAVKARVRVILEGDWTKTTLGSFRSTQGLTNRKELTNLFQKQWNSKGDK